MTAAEKLAIPASETNLIEMLLARVASPRGPAATHKTSTGWVDVSWAEVLEQVKAVSNALVGWGVKPGDRVAIFAATSLRYAVVDLAISAARAVSVPIYASNTADEVRYVLANSGAVLLFVDDDVPDARQPGRLTRTRQKLAEAPDCRQVVLFEGEGDGAKELALATFLEKGRDVTDFGARAKAIQSDDLCHFIYTSGTTGDPKGVMLSHGNWAYEAHAIRALGTMVPEDSVMLFLPLAHSFAQVVKAAWVGLGVKLIFAESVEKVVSNLAETKPTILPAVPRVFEKVFAGVQGNALGAPGVKGALARWAFRLFDEYVEAKEAGREYDTLGFALAKKLVFSKVRAGLDEKLGGRMRLFISGGAPLPRKIGWFFDLLGFIVCEGYGLTETSAGSFITRPGAMKIGTVGKPFPGVEVKLASDGEILLRGPGIMKGYYRNETATAEVLEADGWFHSGDIGELDADGFLKITGRKKELIVTAGGKNVAPAVLEDRIRAHWLISQCMVVGDNRPFIAALVTLDIEALPAWLEQQNRPVDTPLAELAGDPTIVAEVQSAIDEGNKAVSKAEAIRKFEILDVDWTEEGGQLTPSMKLKRNVVMLEFSDQVESLYT